MIFLSSLIALVALSGAHSGPAETPALPGTNSCAADAGWNDPAPPRHIHGVTWYVGTCGISAILITSEQGHVLIDGATEKAATLIEANVRALGFRVEDIRFLLNSHEHHDHAGGLDRLQRDSGAVAVAREPAAAALLRGQGDRSDPQFLSARKFPPLRSIKRLDEAGTIAFGTIQLTAHATPGHTPGSTTWTWKSCDSGHCLDIVYADSLTPMSDDSFRFTDDSSHPGYLAAFWQSIERVAALPCDILLTPHPGASDLWARMGSAAPQALVDSGACRRYAEAARSRLAERVAGEKEGSGPSP